MFIPHLGCPCRCTFCNQRVIAGQAKLPTCEEIENAVKTAVKYTASKELELAFFGGSFTMIDRGAMLSFLDLAKQLVNKYNLYGIRFSTRPDGISEEIMTILSNYPVTAVELGVQSMSDRVLEASQRGHTVKDTENAVRLVKNAGAELVLQMMVGMPESSRETDLETALKIANLSPDAVRIYPVLVLAGTELEAQYRNGKYNPLSLEEAVSRTCEIIKLFGEKNIPIIKVGLQAEEGFDSGKTLVAGPYHQAFRELCDGSIYFEKILAIYTGKDAVIRCAAGEFSKVKGHKKANEIKLKTLYPSVKITFEESNLLKKGEIEIT